MDETQKIMQNIEGSYQTKKEVIVNLKIRPKQQMQGSYIYRVIKVVQFCNI